MRLAEEAPWQRRQACTCALDEKSNHVMLAGTACLVMHQEKDKRLRSCSEESVSAEATMSCTTCGELGSDFVALVLAITVALQWLEWQ